MQLTFEKKMQVYGVSAALLACVIVLGFFWGPVAQTQKKSSEPLIKGLNPSLVAEVRIHDFALVKDASGVWQVQSQGEQFPAESTKVEDLFKSLSELKIVRTLSSAGDNPSAFGFSDGLAAVVLLDKEGKTLASLDMGTPLESGREIPVRHSGLPSIYGTDSSLSSTLNNNFHTWTDLRLFGDKPDEKSVVEVLWNGKLTLGETAMESFHYKREVKDGNEKWVNLKDSSVVEGLAAKLPVLVQLRAQENGLRTQSDYENLPHELKITLGTRILSFRIGEKDANGKYPVTEGNRRFRLSEYSLRDLLLQ